MNNSNERAVFTARMEEIPIIISFVLQNAAPAGITDKRLMHLELALEEILVNIINYAYEISPGEIFVETQIAPKNFQVNIIDNGKYFDPLAIDLPDVSAKLEERPIGGLGIMLVRNIMDEVHYLRSDGRNKTTFVVYTDK